MKFEAAALSALLVLWGASLGLAGPLVDAAERAEALQAEGKTVEALDALDEAIDAIWKQSPLAFSEIVLIKEAGTDAYVERADRSFQPDDKLALRVEPLGFGYGSSTSGARIGFTGDLVLENATGQVLSETKDLFQISQDTFARQRNFPITLSFTVPYVRPGDYIARFTIRDQNSDKTGSFDVPFKVAVPIAATAAPEPVDAATPAAEATAKDDAESGDPAAAPADGSSADDAAPQ